MDELLEPGRLLLPHQIATDLVPDFNLDLTKKHQPSSHHQLHLNLQAFPDDIVIDKHTKVILSKIVKRVIAVIWDGPKSLVLHCELLRMPKGHTSTNNECVIKIRRVSNKQLDYQVRREVYGPTDHYFYYQPLPTHNEPLVEKRLRQEVRRLTDIEWTNLRRMNDARLRVPEVYAVKQHVLFMEYLQEKGTTMSRLNDLKFRLDHAKEMDIYWQTVAMMHDSYNKANLIHTRLTETDILVNEAGQCWFLDIETAVDKSHPEAMDLLVDVCLQVAKMFAKRGLTEILQKDELLQHITESSSTNRQSLNI